MLRFWLSAEPAVADAEPPLVVPLWECATTGIAIHRPSALHANTRASFMVYLRKVTHKGYVSRRRYSSRILRNNNACVLSDRRFVPRANFYAVLRPHAAS